MDSRSTGANKVKINEATWRCCEPTCLSLKSLFDFDLHDLWPGPTRPLISRSHVKYTIQSPWKTCFFFICLTLTYLTLTCLTLTFVLDSCDLWPWPLWPLTSRPKVKHTMLSPSKSSFFFYIVTLTFDLWPRPLHMTCISFMFITI